MGSGRSQRVFATVKSFSQRGKLLSKAELQTLAESRDLDELITRIKNTKYADSVAKVVKPYTAATIESALRSKLADIHYSIAKTAGDSDILDAYYLKFIISNLKMILKGKALGKTQEEIEPYLNLHAEELIKQRDVVIKSLVAKDLEEAVVSMTLHTSTSGVSFFPIDLISPSSTTLSSIMQISSRLSTTLSRRSDSLRDLSP